MATARDLPDVWRERAKELRKWGAQTQAQVLETAANDLERTLDAAEDETLTLHEGAQESGYSAERLRALVASGAIPNAGRKGAPRIRRADLPRKPQRKERGGFDPRAAAQRVLAGGDA